MAAQAGPGTAPRPLTHLAEPPAGSTAQACSSAFEAPQGHDPHHDSRKPIFHVMPITGWGSDPNGPIFWKGRYHL